MRRHAATAQPAAPIGGGPESAFTPEWPSDGSARTAGAPVAIAKRVRGHASPRAVVSIGDEAGIGRQTESGRRFHGAREEL